MKTKFNSAPHFKQFLFANCVLLFLIGANSACVKDQKEDSKNEKQSTLKEIKFLNFLQHLSKKEMNSLTQRDEASYTVDESVYVLEASLNHEYSFGTNNASHLVDFQDEFTVQTSGPNNPVISESILNDVFDSIKQSLIIHYNSIEGNQAKLVVIDLDRLDNVNAQGMFTIMTTSIFSTTPAVYLADDQLALCTNRLCPFGSGDDWIYGTKYGPCAAPCDPYDPLNNCSGATTELEREINQTFDPNPDVFYTEIDRTCAAGPGFALKCLRPVVFNHDVVNPNDVPDNNLDYKVFWRTDQLPNYRLCVEYDHLNCYYNFMRFEIAPQYGSDIKSWFSIRILHGLIADGTSKIGHGNTLFYGIKMTRIIGQHPKFPTE